jgi:hypothetical protein
MGTWYGYPEAGGEQGRMRAGDADRDRVAELLNTAYVEGRLSRDEHDARLESALSARTYADLDQLVSDLPAAHLTPAYLTVMPQPETTVATSATTTNGFAIASLVCGLAQFAFGPLASIPAIAFGHMALRQIRRSGEQGAVLALAGLILGWAAVILGIVVIVAGLSLAAGMHATVPTH